MQSKASGLTTASGLIYSLKLGTTGKLLPVQGAQVLTAPRRAHPPAQQRGFGVTCTDLSRRSPPVSGPSSDPQTSQAPARPPRPPLSGRRTASPRSTRSCSACPAGWLLYIQPQEKRVPRFPEIPPSGKVLAALVSRPVRGRTSPPPARASPRRPRS